LHLQEQLAALQQELQQVQQQLEEEQKVRHATDEVDAVQPGVVNCGVTRA
jgi:chaperonin cofactor prefoldin